MMIDESLIINYLLKHKTSIIYFKLLSLRHFAGNKFPDYIRLQTKNHYEDTHVL
jgi:hypothetical protein